MSGTVRGRVMLLLLLMLRRAVECHILRRNSICSGYAVNNSRLGRQ